MWTYHGSEPTYDDWLENQARCMSTDTLRSLVEDEGCEDDEIVEEYNRRTDERDPLDIYDEWRQDTW